MKTSILSMLMFFTVFTANAFYPSERMVNILNSGDGKSYKTAYEINSIEEEYQLLEHLKLIPTMQMLSIIEGQYYDILVVGDERIYFKLIPKHQKQSV